MIYALIKVPLYLLQSVWNGCVVHSVIKNTITGSKLHVVVSANVILIWSQFKFPEPGANEIHSEEQIK